MKMTPQELEISNRSYDLLAAIAVGIGTTFLFACLYFFVGLVIGVIGIHRSPTDASRLYYCFSPAVLIPGIVSSIMAFRFFRKQIESKLKQEAEQ
jgi:uncharacterized membrane protein YiaA